MSGTVTGPVVATFEATRSELVGDEIGLGAAELARRVCRRAERRVSVVCVDRSAMRRIDGWLTADGFVTHPAGAEDERRVGSLCAADGAVALVGAIVGSLSGGLPTRAASAGARVDRIDRWSPTNLPFGRAVVVSSVASEIGQAHHLVLADADGLAGASAVDLSAVVLLAPVEPVDVARLVGGVLAPAPRTIAELLEE